MWIDVGTVLGLISFFILKLKSGSKLYFDFEKITDIFIDFQSKLKHEPTNQ